LHIIFRGKYIPQKWLSKQWAEIHKSPVVDIRSLYETKKGLTGITFYLIGNYLAKQSFERMSWGYSWIFPAFVSSWKCLVEKYGFRRGLELWNRLLCSPFVVTRQVRLTKFLPQYNHTSEEFALGCAVPNFCRVAPGSNFITLKKQWRLLARATQADKSNERNS
jgi:hypothetical protein